MFIAMNRFQVKRGSEDAFEKVWLTRETYLDRVPGFVEFHLLKGPEAEDHTLYASHTVWQNKGGVRGVDQIGRISCRACTRRQREHRTATILSIRNLKDFEVRQTIDAKSRRRLRSAMQAVNDSSFVFCW